MTASLPRDPAADIGAVTATVASLLDGLDDVDDPATDLDDVAGQLARAHGLLSDALDAAGRAAAVSPRP